MRGEFGGRSRPPTQHGLPPQISEASGRPLAYQAIPLEAVRAQGADSYRMMEWFAETGYSADIDGLRREFPEIGWLRFRDWARTQDWERILGADPAARLPEVAASPDN